MRSDAFFNTPPSGLQTLQKSASSGALAAAAAAVPAGAGAAAAAAPAAAQGAGQDGAAEVHADGAAEKRRIVNLNKKK
jgi:hypothetical protein